MNEQDQDRRNFLKTLGLMGATVTVAPEFLARPLKAAEIQTRTRVDGTISRVREIPVQHLVSTFPFPVYDCKGAPFMYFYMHATQTPKELQDPKDPFAMSFTISKDVVGKEPHPEEQTTLSNFFKDLPITTIGEERSYTNKGKGVMFDLERLSNKVARKSRRGRGNLILHDYLSPLPPVAVNRWTWLPVLQLQNTYLYVLVYSGSFPYDQAFFGFKNVEERENEGIIYRPNPHWRKYVQRFDLAKEALV